MKTFPAQLVSDGIPDEQIVLMAAYIALRREATNGNTASRAIAQARHHEAVHQALEAELWGTTGGDR